MKMLTAEAADRLAKLCGMFGSHHDGERANAALKADQLVRQNGLTWYDVITIPQREVQHDQLDAWRSMAYFCHAHQEKLNIKEYGFITSMLRWRGELSDKQSKWLIDLYLRCGGAS
jgi:hypothetical protein